MKKLIAVLMMLVMALGLIACKTEASPQGNAAGQISDAVDYSKVKIGVISNTTAQDGGWGTALYDSLKKAQEQTGMTDEQIIWVESIYDGTADVDNMIDQMVGEGCNVIMAHSAGYVDQLKTAAEKYPDVYFCGYECPVEGLDNYAMYSISDQAASFLCGYIAARMSESDEIGYIGNMPTSDLICCLDAFAVGAKYANENAKVKIIWINSWYDPATEKEAANSLLESGHNVIGYMGSTASVAQACGEHQGFTTGMYIDMHDYAPGAVLTSHIFDWTLMIKQLFDMVATDSWSGAPIIYGFEDGAARIADLNTEIVPEDIAKDFEEVKGKLMSGELTVFSGPLYDNEGTLIVEEGKELSGNDLIYIHFLADNVIGAIP